ncbi:hypothetical protein D3C85_1810530 [compost metagenome]
MLGLGQIELDHGKLAGDLLQVLRLHLDGDRFRFPAFGFLTAIGLAGDGLPGAACLAGVLLGLADGGIEAGA